MESPDYYLADLPPEASLTPDVVQQAAIAVKRNRARCLELCSTASIVSTLAALGEECLQASNPQRRRMLAEGPASTGLSQTTLAAGLDLFFKSLTRDALSDLIRQDLGHERRLDEICSTPAEQRAAKSALATGPELIAHITPRNLPVSAMQSMVLGLIVKSAQFVRCPAGSSLIPRLFAHVLHTIDPKLGACLELAEWPSERKDLTEMLIAESQCVSASGQDESLAQIRSMVSVGKRFIAHGHRLSFAFIGKEMLNPHNLARVAGRAAFDVAAWDQLGCLSPHVVYVEEGGPSTPEMFAEKLAQELDRIELEDPRAPLPTAAAASIATRRSFFEVRQAAGNGTRIWSSQGSTAWTVVYEPDPRFQMSCLHRFIYVKGGQSIEQVLHASDSFRDMVSTVGICVSESQAAEVAAKLARWGVTRVCPLGRMQQPPATWRHDGRLSLAELVRWTDWEH